MVTVQQPAQASSPTQVHGLWINVWQFPGQKPHRGYGDWLTRDIAIEVARNWIAWLEKNYPWYQRADLINTIPLCEWSE